MGKRSKQCLIYGLTLPMRLVEIVLDFSLQGDFAITHDDATISVAMCPTCDWSVVVDNVQAIATEDEHRQLRALF